MNLTLKPAVEYDFLELADLLNQAFAGYFVSFNFTTAMLMQMVRQDCVDLMASQVALIDEDTPVAVALVARRGWASRVAVMGVVTEARGRGIGRWLMEQLIGQARHRGERLMMLEVVEQNVAALKLYQQLGFQIKRRLVGYSVQPPYSLPTVKTNGHGLQEVDLRQVAQALTRHGLPDLPWQISGDTLAQKSLPHRGYSFGPAYTAITDPTQPHVSIQAIVVESTAQRQGWGRQIIHALMTQYPDKLWKLPPLFPEEVMAPLFESLNFGREPLSQLQMMLDLVI